MTTAGCCSCSRRRSRLLSSPPPDVRTPPQPLRPAARPRPDRRVVSSSRPATKPTKLGLDLQGGVQLVYQGKPTPAADGHQEALAARAGHHARARRRVRRRRARARCARREPDRGQPAGRRGRRARRPAGRLHRPAVLLRLGSEHPRRGLQDQPETEINGGQQPITGFYNAVKRASKCDDPRAEEHAGGRRPALLRVRQGLQEAVQQRQPASRAPTALDGADARRSRSSAEVVEVPPGILVVRDEKPDADRARPPTVLGHPGQPGALGHGHQEPRAELRPAGGQRADRHVRLHGQGPQGVPDDHARDRPARRRQRHPLQPRPEQNSQHFAIVLDNELVSAPYINYRENPDGIDGSTGAQISGGFTIPSAQDLAKILKIGALPIRLELISRSQVSATLGKQALDQGLIAGVAGFVDRRAVPDRLLPRARRHRGRRAGHLRALLLRARQADPDHADAAGHRGPDPHARRRGGREHRHLRTRQGGGARGQIGVRRPSPRATGRACRRSSTRTSSRSSSRSSSSSSPRRA